jgi:hypothetical protein
MKILDAVTEPARIELYLADRLGDADGKPNATHDGRESCDVGLPTPSGSGSQTHEAVAANTDPNARSSSTARGPPRSRFVADDGWGQLDLFPCAE